MNPPADAMGPRPGLPPPPRALRWAAMVAISLAMFGNSYISDCIGPLAKVLSDQLHYTNSDIGLLQALCNVPSIFTVLLGGIIVDRIGAKKAGTIFAFFGLAGAVISALSPRLPVMLAGRFIFGLGIASLSVASTTGISQWFSGEKLSFVFGLNLTISRLGSLAAQVSPTWAREAYTSWRAPLLIAIGFGVIGVLAMGVYWALENRAEGRYQVGLAQAHGPSARKEAPGFSRAYWLVVLVCVTFYSGIFPFQTFAQKFFVEAHGAAAARASLLVGTLTVIAMIATPLCGLLVDRVGKRALLMMLGTAMQVPVYWMMTRPGSNLFLPMTLMGLSFSLIPAILWPYVMLLVPPGKLGKALGLMSLVQSIGLTGFNFLIGWANDVSRASAANPSGYDLGMGLFTLTSLLGFLFAFLLLRHEKGSARRGSLDAR